jgi:hypothetical protein
LIIVPPRSAAGWRRNVTVGPQDGFASLVDLFPTVMELLGVAPSVVPPGQLSGTSLAPFLRETFVRGMSAPSPAASFSQIVRADRPCTAPSGDMQQGDSSSILWCNMGLTIRTLGWRYTAWVDFAYIGQTQGPNWDNMTGEELYDHTEDDAAPGPTDQGLDYDKSELINVVGDPAHAAIRAALLQQLKAAFPPFHVAQ